MTSLVSALSSELDAVLMPVLGSTPIGRVCILDAPDYPNVGDPAMLVGEIEFFRRHFPGVKFTFVSQRNYDETVDREIEKADLIVINGGGNFGDIWPRHHAWRLRLMKRFAHRRMVQLPQSIHFSKPEAMEETRQAIASMADFRMVTRDRRSFALAQASFDCPVALTPDMVFALGEQTPPTPSVDLLCLLRTDREQVAGRAEQVQAYVRSSGRSHKTVDWLSNRLNIEKVHFALRQGAKFGISKAAIARHAAPLYEAYARSRLAFGLGLLGEGRVVVTDRLHGHILSTLLGKKQVVFDSLDGKVRMMNETWLSANKDAAFVSTTAEMGEALQRLDSQRA